MKRRATSEVVADPFGGFSFVASKSLLNSGMMGIRGDDEEGWASGNE